MIMARRQREFVVGLFSLIGIVALVFLTLQIKGTSLFEGSYRVRVRFPEVAGSLVRGASVLIYGVKVGDVLDIRIDPSPEYPEEPVEIELRIRESMRLYQDAEVEVVESAIFGETTVVMSPGSPNLDPLGDGVTIHGRPPADILGDIAQRAPEIIMEIAQSVTMVNDFIRDLNDEGQITRSINDLAAIIGFLREMVDDEQGDLRAVATNLRGFTANLEQTRSLLDQTLLQASSEMHTLRVAMTESISTLTGDAQGGIVQATDAMASLEHTLGFVDQYMTGNIDRWEAITAQIEAAAVGFNRLLDRLDSGEGTVGRLLTDERLYDEILRLLSQMNRWLGSLDSILGGAREPLGERVVPYEETPRTPAAP